MKVAISYFAQIRNFKPNMIPVSTAMFDPKWFHDFKGPRHVFFDKKRVINGARCEMLVPPKDLGGLCRGKETCSEVGKGTCEFLEGYTKWLDNLDFSHMQDYLNRMEEWAEQNLHIPTDDLVLVFMVYEKYDNPCSERNAIINYFKNNGMDIAELSYPIQ